MDAAFKAAARAGLVPDPEPVSKKAAKRRGGEEGCRFTTEWIVADRLGLCRDPYNDLSRWIEFCRKGAFVKGISKATHDNANDRNIVRAIAAKFLRNTLQELSGQFRANDNQRLNGSHAPDRSTAGVQEHRQLQQFQGERVGRADSCCHGGDRAEICALYGYYAALIAAARGSLRAAEAAGFVRKLQDEQAAAVRNVEDRQRGERKNWPKPERHNNAQRRSPGTMRLH